MTYYKPKDVTYTQMCIWCDENAYKDDCDTEKLYQYLYLIALMLAHKKKYFNHQQLYDEFALYVATRVYFRIHNPKQYIILDDGTPKMLKIKSVLNYIKSILYPCKASYETETYAQITLQNAENELAISFNFDDEIQESLSDIEVCEFRIYLQTIIKTIKKLLERIRPRYSKVDWTNIYLSCLLTILAQITVDNDLANKFCKNGLIELTDLEKLYKIQSQEVVLFHIDDSMKSLIKVLVNEIKDTIAKDLSYATRTPISAKNNLKNLIVSSLTDDEFEDD